jgi:hypothetical protein
MDTDYEEITPHHNFMDRAKESGPIGMAGLAAVLFAVVLLAGSVYFTKTRRQLFILIAAAIGVGVGGYITFDRTFIMLNLSMRDVESVRADCRALLQRQNSAAPTGTQDLQLSGTALPASFVRLGAKDAIVTKTNIRICLSTDWGGGAWGFLYATQPADSGPDWPRETRHTWYRDFYEFRVRGE